MLVYVKHVGHWAGPFWHKGYNLNNPDKGPLDVATYQNIKDLGILVSVKKIFKCFPYGVHVKHVGPWAGPFLAQGL